MRQKIRRSLASSSILALALLASTAPASNASKLSLGADIDVKGVAMREWNKNMPSNQYISQKMVGYMTTDLSSDVEASIKVQSISPWGLETSTVPLATRYPNANGSPWIQNAYLRLPQLWDERLILTIGRQPFKWGDGEILSDDDLGFDAVRAQIVKPFRWLPINVDLFTAKMNETFQEKQDTDLYGGMVSFDHNHTTWEFMDLIENVRSPSTYQAGASTTPFLASSIKRSIMGVRAKVTVKDAYLKGAYYLQSGTVKRDPSAGGGNDMSLGGAAYSVGLGAVTRVRYLGRFGANADYSVGDGGSASEPDKDTAFRATYQSRWSGLERKGNGQYFAGTFSDAYSASDPFATVTSSNTGLPPGVSGIQTIKFGVDMTPWSKWTFTLDMFLLKAMSSSITGKKGLGTEIDYGVIYKYSGFVSFKASAGFFNPGDAYDPDLKQKASGGLIETQIHF